MTRRQARRGYALLMTLMLTALAATAMVGVSRGSMRKALASLRAEEDLQRRWGQLTSRAALLSRAEAALEQAQGESKHPVSTARVKLELGKQTFLLVFADEQAKVNINGFYDRRGLAETDRLVREFYADPDHRARVQLSPVRPPLKDPESAGSMPAAFEGWGQVFSHITPLQIIGDDRHAPMTGNITCWGDRALNFHRATPHALEVVCEPVLSQTELIRLLAIREGSPDVPLSNAIDALKLSRRKRDEVTKLLTDESSCHSLWIVVETKERTWHQLTISGAAGNGFHAVSFNW